MKMAGYTNPIRSFERKLAPDYAQREFRDPGLRSSSGLGSLRHTMPHLQKMTATRLQGGGSLNPVGEAYAASRPNLYNPDPMHRRILALEQQLAGSMGNTSAMRQLGAGFQLPYADGGVAPDEAPHNDFEELLEPGENLSPHDEQAKQVVTEALLALEGQHPDPKEALDHFIDTFGPQALGDLQRLLEQQHAGQDETEEQDEEGGQPTGPDPDLQAAGGGFLHGPGSGQSDEIEGATPTGRPVLLSDGEYVIDAPTVAALGDGSSDAGARRLDQLRRQIRKDAYGHEKQAKPMKKGGSALVIRLGK
jgi:hypothetical protein